MADVKKNAFMLSSATVMLAPAFTTDVYSLIPATHSIGMVKEVNVTVDSSEITLQNGVANATIDTRKTNVAPMISMTVFEYTAQNAAYAGGLAGTTTGIKRGVLTVALAAEAVSMSINSDPIPGEASSAITGVGDIPAGSTLLLQRPNGEVDYVFPTKSSGVATGTGPYTIPIAGDYKIPLGVTFPVGTKVYVLPAVAIGDINSDQLFCAKITGTLSNYDRPVTAVFPKLKIISGFNISFTEGEYGGMPWQLKPLLMSSTEAAGRLADIGSKRFGDVYIGA